MFGNKRKQVIKKIVCLANSKKFNERCVAGVEVEGEGNKFNIVKSYNLPNWIRPVSKTGHGEFPTRVASELSVLDVIEFDVEAFCPNGYQSENAYFIENSVKSIAKVVLSKKNLDQLTSVSHLLFGNRGRAVHCDVVDGLSHSLLFIKVESFNPYIKQDNNQLRMTFSYNRNEYDLPVTDIQFEITFRANPSIFVGISHLYLTISLAVENNGWHTKLIAGVIYL